MCGHGSLRLPQPGEREGRPHRCRQASALLAAATLLTGWHWIIACMAVGFLARVLTGPKLSVLGQLATRVIAPRLGMPRFVPGPPKRFAQAIGLTLTTVAAVSSLAFGADLLAHRAGQRAAGVRHCWNRWSDSAPAAGCSPG